MINIILFIALYIWVSVQEVLEKYRKKNHIEKGKEPLDEYEQRILKTDGPFFFEMERCIPTAAVSTSVINRL